MILLDFDGRYTIDNLFLIFSCYMYGYTNFEFSLKKQAIKFLTNLALNGLTSFAETNTL